MKTIVYGPGASGKTTIAEELRALWGLARVVDGWDGRTPLRKGDLALTNRAPPYDVRGLGNAHVISIEVAKQIAAPLAPDRKRTIRL